MVTTTETPYEVVIGLEVHAQVLSRSKMFCRCSTAYSGDEPNTHVCPVCMGMPGVLPVINERAVEATIRTGLALNCTIPERAKFDRKNYPYPDLMKGYQISEYDQPLCINGYLDVDVDGETRRIRINRVHLEEDTARLMHRSDVTGDYSLLDVNRAGMPLMEIVTEPDARSPQEALAYLIKLRQILRYIGVSEANMEEGSFRCEPNLSLRLPGAEYGSKVELKNLASFRAALRGTEFEVARQTKILRSGGHVVSETRGWRDEIQETASQRSKEQAHDYRYFPEPDLPYIAFPRDRVEALRASLPELPDTKRARFISEYDLLAQDAALLAESRATAEYFEAAVKAWPGSDFSPQLRARFIKNQILGDLSRLANLDGLEPSDTKISPHQLAKLSALIETDVISRSAGKQVIAEMYKSGEDPDRVITQLGLGRIEDDGVVTAAVEKVIDANPKAVADYKAGKLEAVKFLVGQVMRETRGRANAADVQTAIVSALDGA